MLKHLLVAASLLATSIAQGAGITVVVTVNGTATTVHPNLTGDPSFHGDVVIPDIVLDGDPLAPNLQPVTGVVTVAVFESGTSLPSLTVRRVKLVGSAGPGARIDLVFLRPIGTDYSLPATPASSFLDRLAIKFLGRDPAIENYPADTGPHAGQILVFENPDVPSDTSLRDHTRLAIGVLEGVYSSDNSPERGLVVGKVFRIQAGVAGQTPLGTITSTIHTTQPDSALGDGQHSIGYIVAGKQIAGDVRAGGLIEGGTFPAELPPCSIGRIAVGPSPDALGIVPVTGQTNPLNISATETIEQVWSTGPIGVPTYDSEGRSESTVVIQAGERILQVKSMSEGGQPGDETANVSISAGLKSLYRGTGFEGLDLSDVSLSMSSGAIGGVYLPRPGSTASVYALNLNPALDDRVDARGHGGIFVNGEVGTVEIGLNAEGDIIAESFATVIIGHALRGSVIAFGYPTVPSGYPNYMALPNALDPMQPPTIPLRANDAGVIGRLEIGYGPKGLGECCDCLDAEPPCPRLTTRRYINPAWEATYNVGFCAVNRPPLDMNPGKVVGQSVTFRTPWEAYVENPLPAGPADQYAMDGVIRARVFGKNMRIARMTQVYRFADGRAASKPRLECPAIDKSSNDVEQQIIRMECGVVWSGKHNWTFPPPPALPVLADDWQDNFVQMANMKFDTVSPPADIYMKDFATNRIHTLCGEVHYQTDESLVNSLRGRLLIDRLGAVARGPSPQDDAPDIAAVEGLFAGQWQVLTLLTTERTPRMVMERETASGVVDEPLYATRGAVRVYGDVEHNFLGLQGQISVFGSWDGEDLAERRLRMRGEVRIFAERPEEQHVVIATDSPEAYQPPIYKLTEAVFGNVNVAGPEPVAEAGAVGLFPFALDGVNCFPAAAPFPGLAIRPQDLNSAREPSTHDVTLAHFGPVSTPGGPGATDGDTAYQALKVYFRAFAQDGLPPPAWTDITAQFRYRETDLDPPAQDVYYDFARDDDQRDIVLKLNIEDGGPIPQAAPGFYAVVPSPDLYCELGPGERTGAAVPAYPFAQQMPEELVPPEWRGRGAYYFFVARCLVNGNVNPCDITEVGGTVEFPGLPDGQYTVDDLILFINLFSEGAGCPGETPCSRADVTSVGGVSGPDGQLTVDDLIVFVNGVSDGCSD